MFIKQNNEFIYNTINNIVKKPYIFIMKQNTNNKYNTDLNYLKSDLYNKTNLLNILRRKNK